MKSRILLAWMLVLFLGACKTKENDESLYESGCPERHKIITGPSYTIRGIVYDSKTKLPLEGYRIMVMDYCAYPDDYSNCSTEKPGHFLWTFRSFYGDIDSFGCTSSSEGARDLYIFNEAYQIGRIAVDNSLMVAEDTVAFFFEFEVPPPFQIGGTSSSLEKEVSKFSN